MAALVLLDLNLPGVALALDLIEEIPELAGRAQKGGDPAIDRAVRSLRRR